MNTVQPVSACLLGTQIAVPDSFSLLYSRAKSLTRAFAVSESVTK